MIFVSFPNNLAAVKATAPLKAENPVHFMYWFLRRACPLSADRSKNGWSESEWVTLMFELREDGEAAFALLNEVFEGVEIVR